MIDVAIPGLPKAGTNTIFEMLQQSPDVAKAHEKEPHYFATDLPALRKVKTAEKYRESFDGDGLRVDGSVFYLFSSDAVSNIMNDNPACRFIVMLHNPALLVFSMHNQFRRGLMEDTPTVAQAWAAQEARKQGQALPRYAPEPSVLQYGDLYAVGDQVERLLANVPREQVLFLPRVDLAREPESTTESISRFLGIELPSGIEPGAKNQRREFRNHRVESFLQDPPRPVGVMMDIVKRTSNSVGIRPMAVARPLLTRRAGRSEVDVELVAELTEFFAPQIERAAELSGIPIEKLTA